MSGPEVLASYFLVNEGIEHRLKRAAQEESWEGFLNQAVSKTYSKARIQRTCVFILMQITKAEMAQHKSFDQACILGANEKGRAYLKSLESNQIYLRARDFPPFLRRVRAQTHHLVQCITGIDTKEHFIV
jgi:predicted nucleotidyltransferase